MKRLIPNIRLLEWAILAAACMAAQPTLQTEKGKLMNAYLPLYGFTHAGDWMGIARLTQVQTHPGPRDGQESVTIDLITEENLWGDRAPASRTYGLERPVSRASQLKFPDPIWGRVDLRPGSTVLLVTPPASAKQAADPAYVDEVPKLDDPILRSIKDLLQAERGEQTDANRFARRLRWLTTGDSVQKLFAGEALAKNGVPHQAEAEHQLGLAFANAFAQEQDVYVKISLGTWLWDHIFARSDQASRINIINVTIQAASSTSGNVRMLALDRLSETDPELLRKPGVNSSREVVQLLEERRQLETDTNVRDNLDRIITALRR